MPTSTPHREATTGTAKPTHERPAQQTEDAPPPKTKKELDKELDKALMDSFPASDPPSPSQPTGTEPAGDPKTKP